MMVAAMTGPTPKMPVRVVPGMPDHDSQFFLRLAQLAVEAAQVGQELAGELVPGPGDRAGRRDLAEDASGLSCGDLLGDAAGDQAAQHRVQAAGDLRAAAGQVTPALGPDLQHRRVVIGPGLTDTGRAQRGHRDHEGSAAFPHPT